MTKLRSDTPRTDKPTILTVQVGSGRHVAAVTLFSHLMRALEGQSLSGVTTIIIAGDGGVRIEREGRTEIVYIPRRFSQRERAE